MVLAKAAKRLGKVGSKLGKKSDDIVDVAKKTDDISKRGASSGSKIKFTKKTDDLASGSNQVTKNASNIADDVPSQIGKKVDETVESANIKKGDWLKANKGKVFKIGAASIAAGTLAGLALEGFLRKQNTEFLITKYEKAGSNKIWLHYQFADQEKENYFDFKTYDRIELISNNCSPKLKNKLYDIEEVEDRKVMIKVDEIPKSLGDVGLFKYKTDFKNQIRNGTETIIKTGGETAGSIFDGFLDALGIDMETFKKILIGLGVGLLLLFIIYIVIMFT